MKATDHSTNVIPAKQEKLQRPPSSQDGCRRTPTRMGLTCPRSSDASSPGGGVGRSAVGRRRGDEARAWRCRPSLSPPRVCFEREQTHERRRRRRGEEEEGEGTPAQQRGAGERRLPRWREISEEASEKVGGPRLARGGGDATPKRERERVPTSSGGDRKERGI